MNDDITTLKHIVARVLADVDIFLLQDESQTKDNDKEYFHRNEIREQLMKTARKMYSLPLNWSQEIEIDINYL